MIFACFVLVILVVTSFVSIQLLKHKVNKSTIKYTADSNEAKIKEVSNDEPSAPVNNDLDNNQEIKEERGNNDGGKGNSKIRLRLFDGF